MLIELQGNITVSQHEQDLSNSISIVDTVKGVYNIHGGDITLEFAGKAQIHISMIEALEMQNVLSACIHNYLCEYRKELIADE